MKLSGNTRGGRHLLKNVGKQSARSYANTVKVNNREGNKRRRPKLVKIILASVAVVAAAAITVLALDLFAETDIVIRLPDVNMVPRPSVSQPSNPNNPNTASVSSIIPGEVLDNVRDRTALTFLIFGLDEGANTDVIMVASLDTVDNSLSVVSIPRDTLVNVDWSMRMANTIYPNMMARYRSESDRAERENLAMQASVEKFADILGFEVDFWVIVNMRAFTTLIDAVGGIDFYVPVRMNYVDNYAGLHINFQRGMHRGLTGQQALEILRFRSFANADIGRINVQQQFLTAAVEQILARRSSLGSPQNITRLADIAFNHVRTNLSLVELAALGREFMQLSPENISFATIPHWINDFIVNRGYVVIDLEPWLEMLNEMLNPFSNDKTAEDLSILTRGEDRRLFVTDGNWAGNPNWGSASRGPNQRQGGGEGLNVVAGGGGGAAGGTAPPPATQTTPASGSSGDDTDEPDGQVPHDGEYPEYPPGDFPDNAETPPIDDTDDTQQYIWPDTPAPEQPEAPEIPDETEVPEAPPDFPDIFDIPPYEPEAPVAEPQPEQPPEPGANPYSGLPPQIPESSAFTDTVGINTQYEEAGD